MSALRHDEPDDRRLSRAAVPVLRRVAYFLNGFRGGGRSGSLVVPDTALGHYFSSAL